MSRRVLLVADDLTLSAAVRGALEKAGFSVAWTPDLEGSRPRSPHEVDLVVLDLEIAGARGLEVLRAVRRASDVPVIVLSGTRAPADRVRALRSGADDAVEKPVQLEELSARAVALLRRPGLEVLDRIRAGPFLFDLATRRAHVDGRALRLTPLEFDFLAILARRPGAAVSREELAAALLDLGREARPRMLDAHASRLRRKLGDRGRHLRTAWGVGYRLEVDLDLAG